MAQAKNNGGKQEGDGINVPYLNAYGNISRTLEKIQTASTPSRFTQDFLATKLGLPGGGARPVIPFLKRTGFLNGDGTPTELYKKFRNESLRPLIAAQAVRLGYSALYEVNEYAHDLSDKDLMGVIVQTTGLAANSTTAKAIFGSFKALKSFADFEAKDSSLEEEPGNAGIEIQRDLKDATESGKTKRNVDLKLGYTINLNLPATSDIAVFNAIFKSLRDHLLD